MLATTPQKHAEMDTDIAGGNSNSLDNHGCEYGKAFLGQTYGCGRDSGEEGRGGFEAAVFTIDLRQEMSWQNLHR
jgi:hypothetical protein